MKALTTTIYIICLPFLLLAQEEKKKQPARRVLYREIGFGIGSYFNHFGVPMRGGLRFNQANYEGIAPGGRLQILFPVQDVLKIGPAIEYISNDNGYRKLDMLAIGFHFNAPIFIGGSNSYLYPGGDISYVTANPYTGFGFGFHAGLNMSISPRSFIYMEPGIRFLTGNFREYTFPVLFGMRFHL